MTDTGKQVRIMRCDCCYYAYGDDRLKYVTCCTLCHAYLCESCNSWWNVVARAIAWKRRKDRKEGPTC
jgi:hypothetical protein